MKRFDWQRAVVVCLSLALATLGVRSVAAELAPDLEAVLAQKDALDWVSVVVFLKERVDVAQLDTNLEQSRASLPARHETVVRALQDTAQRTQAALLDRLAVLQALGAVRQFEAFWVANAIRVDAEPSAIRALSADPAIDVISLNYPLLSDRADGSGPGSGDRGGPEPALVVLNVPQVWALGIDGRGVLVSGLDTGVDGHHPALASRWRGLDPRYLGHPEWAWRNAVGGSPSFPTDTVGHGTHMMGTICGGAPGDQIGVAPGATWIACDAINQGLGPKFVSDVLAYFQWTIDPDGNPSTSWDVPAVSSNSWSLSPAQGYPPCDPTLWACLDAVEAAGVAVVFSGGAHGPAPNSIDSPADRAMDDYRTLAVGGVDTTTPGWPVLSFSGRGPTYCTPTGAPAVKPNIVGPGLHIRSAYPGGEYIVMDGVSPAVSHISGILALIRQACPDLSVQQMKQIMYQTARDLGAPGEDNTYGWGLPDALAAVTLAMAQCRRPGDLNCDGAVNFADIDPFVLALSGQAAYEAQYPGCHWLNADCNNDGLVDFADIDPFVALLSG